mgnify:CR=1 FL=1
MNRIKGNGFTLIETLVVAAFFIMLLGLLTINVINIEPKTSLTLATSTIIADIKKQQLKAMTGGASSDVISDFGVYLESDKYTLYTGSNYISNNPSNSVIKLSDNITITDIGFPSSTIVFQKGSGEIICKNWTKLS